MQKPATTLLFLIGLKVRLKKWCEEFNGVFAISPLEAARNADIIFTCVGNDDDVKQVILGPNGAIHGLKKNAIIVDHTTASSVLAEELDNNITNAEGFFFRRATIWWTGWC